MRRRSGVRGVALAGSMAVGAGLLALGAAPAPVSAQSAHVLVVTGLGGAPEHSARFTDWGGRMVEAARTAGVPADRVVWLAEREGVTAAAGGVARVEAVAAALDRIAAASEPGDIVLVAFFGHGSARNGESRVNLPGPDLSATALARLLDPLADRRLVVVNAASASGGFLAPLSAPGRVVITATRSAGEAEATRFGGHFVTALAADVADTDKDARVSMLEAFEYARREVARSFAEGGHLPTEHALLDDDGDGIGSLDPAEGEDGRLAAAIALSPDTGAGGAADSPEVAALREREARLRAELDALRARQGEMETAAYQSELERLLLEIARVGRAIREATSEAGGADGGER